MKSRVDVTAIDSTTNFKQIFDIIIESGYSRIPVFEDNIDKISSLEADNATYELDLKINKLKGRYKWLKSNMVE